VPSLEAVMSLERDAVLSLGPVMSLVAVMSLGREAVSKNRDEPRSREMSPEREIVLSVDAVLC
jgi:hypothetical protein